MRLREQFWLAVITDAARADRSLIFTSTPEGTVAAGFPARVQQAVQSAGGRVRFVRLGVSESEQEQRISSASRHRFHELTDLATLRSLRDHRGGVEQPPVDLHVDTDTSSSVETADTIIERFRLTPQQRTDRYPPPQ